jgi:hypothetical protein
MTVWTGKQSGEKENWMRIGMANQWNNREVNNDYKLEDECTDSWMKFDQY